MSSDITRKFLAKNLLDIADKKKDSYERYYLYVSSSKVIRVQKVNGTYELERKSNRSDLIREGESIQITRDEFDELKKFAKSKVIRESYQLQENPKIVVRIYHGDFEGLIRIEVNFLTIEESQAFIPPDWFGREITSTPLAQDGQLLQLTKEEFQKLLI